MSLIIKHPAVVSISKFISKELSKPEIFLQVTGATLALHILLLWLGPTQDSHLVMRIAVSGVLTRMWYLLFCLLDMVLAVAISLVSSGVMSFTLKQSPDVITGEMGTGLIVAPLGVAGLRCLADLALLQIIRGGSAFWGTLYSMLWTLASVLGTTSKLVVVVAAAFGLYGWSAKIGRDRRQVVPDIKKEE
ncbi:uncharacterized protein VTP21DRAFT_5076 [Calcarisporiella thermophila]|uniref:uncharacterized protein n=1 Tax=Calcarisporiella thermophila TaxID=911321 RepID=UPI0037443809